MAAQNWLIIIGLFLSFVGSTILATIGLKSKKRIVKEQSQIIPEGTVNNEEDYERIISEMPKVRALIIESSIAKGGLILISFGFLLQLIGLIRC